MSKVATRQFGDRDHHHHGFQVDSPSSPPPSLLSHFNPANSTETFFSSSSSTSPPFHPSLHPSSKLLSLSLSLSSTPPSLHTTTFSLYSFLLSFYTPHLLSTVFSINQFFSVSIATSTNHTPDTISIFLQAFPAPLLFVTYSKLSGQTHTHQANLLLACKSPPFPSPLLFISSLSPTPPSPTRPLHLLVFFQIKPHTHTHSFASLSLSFPHLDSLFIPMVFSIILSICLYKHTPTHTLLHRHFLS